MRRRSLALFGAGATASLATCALLTTSVVATSLAVLVSPLSPPAAAEELPTFDSCEQLRQWYVDAALPMVGAWGFGWPGAYIEGDVVTVAQRSAASPVAAGAAAVDQAGDQAVGSGETGTNVQEAGVDEPDIAKTNGRLVVQVRGGQLLITDVSGDSPRLLSRTDLPRLIAQPELLLVGDRVLVTGDESYRYGRGPIPVDASGDSVYPGRGIGETTRLVTFDISDPGHPVVTQQDRFDGHLVSAREYDGVVRAVISTGTPDLDFVHPNRRRTVKQAGRANRQIVRETTIDDWLPRVSDGTVAQPLVDCTDVRHPSKPSGFGTISVVTFDARTPTERDTTAVTAGGELVYSSTDRLYVATVRGWGSPVVLRNGGRGRQPAAPTTEVHAFAVDGPATEYVASGKVPGTVRDRWSLSEYDGHLRVATALGRDSWNPGENAVVVMAEDGNDLVETGRVASMGIREQIQSVRWLGPLAVVVTFRQTDPLYTVDLSDPTRPRVLGELKIPGFSSYLHPIGGDLLLGLGQDADPEGRTRGAQAAVFDIGDLADPRRLSTSGFNRATEMPVAWDSRAFTYLPDRRTALTPVQNWNTGRTRLAVLRVDEDGSLSRTVTAPVARWDATGVRTLPVGGDRIAVVAQGKVRMLSIG